MLTMVNKDRSRPKSEGARRCREGAPSRCPPWSARLDICGRSGTAMRLVGCARGDRQKRTPANARVEEGTIGPYAAAARLGAQVRSG